MSKKDLFTALNSLRNVALARQGLVPSLKSQGKVQASAITIANTDLSDLACIGECCDCCDGGGCCEEWCDDPTKRCRCDECGLRPTMHLWILAQADWQADTNRWLTMPAAAYAGSGSPGPTCWRPVGGQVDTGLWQRWYSVGLTRSSGMPGYLEEVPPAFLGIGEPDEQPSSLGLSRWAEIEAKWIKDEGQWEVQPTGEFLCAETADGGLNWEFIEEAGDQSYCLYRRWVRVDECEEAVADPCEAPCRDEMDLSAPPDPFACQARQWVLWDGEIVRQLVCGHKPPGPNFWVRNDQGLTTRFLAWIEASSGCDPCNSFDPDIPAFVGPDGVTFDGGSTAWVRVLAARNAEGLWEVSPVEARVASSEPGSTAWQAVASSEGIRIYGKWHDTGVPAREVADGAAGGASPEGGPMSALGMNGLEAFMPIAPPGDCDCEPEGEDCDCECLNDAGPIAALAMPVKVQAAQAPPAIPSPYNTGYKGGALWKELHERTAALVIQGHLDEAQERQWLTGWSHRLPCGPCKKHWQELVRKIVPDFSSPLALFQWGIKAHNEVNINLDRKPWSLEKALAHYQDAAQEVNAND